MDPLSIIGAASTAITAAITVINYLQDFKHALEERKDWILKMKSTQRYLEELKARLERANLDKSAPWYRNFIEAMGLDDAHLTSGTAVRDLPFQTESPFGQLERKLKALAAKLEIKPGRHHVFVFRGRYHFNKTEFATMFDEILKVQSTFLHTIQLDHFQLSEATHKDVVEVKDMLKNQQSEAEKQEALHYLSKLNFAERQNQIYAMCFKDGLSSPGQWFLTCQEFIAWRAGRPWPLYCVGKPGAGKVRSRSMCFLPYQPLTMDQTVLSSTVIKHLEDHCRQQLDSERFALLYLYLDHKETKSQTYAELIRSILRQLLMGQETQSLCPRALEFFKDSRKGIRPNDDDVLRIIQAQISSHAIQRAYLVVDALDEYPEQERATLLDTLQSLSPKKVSLFLTTRPSDEVKPSYVQCMSCSGYLTIYFHCPVCPSFDICQECKNKNKSCRWKHELVEPRTVTMEVKVPDSEIERFVRYTLNEQLGIVNIRQGSHWDGNTTIGATRLAKLFPSDPKTADELKLDIIEQVVRTADGMFLLAKLHVNSLKLQPSLAAIRRALRDLSPEVDQIYSNILVRIEDQSKVDKSLAIQALTWVVLAHRPLSIEELVQAMAVEISAEELDFEEQTHFDIVLRVTMGLIVNEAGVRTAHRTAQEYFEKHWKDIFPKGQLIIAQTTLKCLGFTALSSPCHNDQEDQQIESRLRNYPFLAYACTYWGEHVQETVENKILQSAVLEFLKSTFRLAATVQAAWYVGSRSQSKAAWDVRAGVNAIQVCAWYGLSSCISELLGQTPDLNVDDQDEKLGQTPLMFACLRGHTSTTSTLLRLGADVNLKNKKGSTTAFMALSNGHPELVDIMLTQEGVDPPLDLNAVDDQDSSRTLLMIAALKAYHSLLSQILERSEVNVNAKDSKGYTALAIAATKSQADIVETLLAHVDINTPNDIGSTPLIIAAEGGKADMVIAMLNKNANWRLQNHDGDTALSKAILHGHTQVVKALLDHGVKHQISEHSKRTVLHVACSSEKTNPDMIKMLIHEGLQVNAQGDLGDTPLHNVSRVGNIGVARTLLDLHADQSIEDDQDRNPLTVAWQNGHLGLTKVLQDYPQRTSHTCNSPPEDSHLPLWSMAKLGHQDLLEFALQTRKAEVQTRDPDTGSTALHWAIRANKLEVARMLLEAGAKTSDLDDHNRTPLHIAAYLSNYEATELLLQFDANPNVRNSWGLTPLSISQSQEQYFLAVRLLEALEARPSQDGALIKECSPQEIQATFCAAVQMGVLSVARLLYKHGVDLEGRNEQRETVMELAKASGDDEMLEWLRQLMYHSDHSITATS